MLRRRRAAGVLSYPLSHSLRSHSLSRVFVWLLVGVLLWVPVAAQFSNVDDFLHPDDAFRLQVERAETGYRATWRIAHEYYLYRDKIAVRVGDARLDLDLPSGETMTDEYFGETEVFRNYVAATFAVPHPTDTLQVTYQGCADAGLCYSPVTKQIALASLTAPGAPGLSNGVSPRPVAPPQDADLSVQDQVLAMLRDGSTAITLLSFLVFGLLLSVTPCVVPIIPILLGTLMRGGPKTPMRAATLSGVFVLAMAAVYSVLGVMTGLLGESVQAWFQTPWLIALFAGVFVLLALAMFGMFSLQMPSFIQSRLSSATTPQRGGGIPGAALMGAGTAFIVGPCVTPALIGALLFIAQTRDALLGGAALFILALGMGLPLIIAGASLGKLVPKPGAARDMANVVIGFFLLGVAVWLLDRVVPATATVFLVGAWLVLAGESLRRVFTESNPRQNVGRGCGMVLLLYGAVLIIGAATGTDSLLKPLARLGATTTAEMSVAKKELPFQTVSGVRETYDAIRGASEDGRPSMLYFHAEWCVSCKELKAFTFSADGVREALSETVLLDADVTENDATDKEMLKEFALFGPPGILFFDREGKEIPAARLVGFISADDFVAHIRRTQERNPR